MIDTSYQDCYLGREYFKTLNTKTRKISFFCVYPAIVYVHCGMILD